MFDAARLVKVVAFVMAVAHKSLFVTDRTTFYVAGVRHMILSLDDSTIVARVTVRAPVVRFVTIPNSFVSLTVDNVSRFELGVFDPFHPNGNHANAIVSDKFLRH